MNPADWNARAACRAADPDLFDTCCAAKTVPHDAATWCNACPVRQQCLDMAMRIEAGTAATYRFGIFGGTSPQQRAKAWPAWAQQHGISPHASRSGLAPCGTAAAYRRHRRNGEPVDAACAAADRRRHAERAARLLPIAHGTYRGARQHENRGQDMCDTCRDAYNTERRVQKARRRARTTQQKQEVAA